MPDRRGVIMLIYDLPSVTAEEKRAVRQFRKVILDNGFTMMQESVYVKLLRNRERGDNDTEYLRSCVPPGGDVRILVMSLAEFRSLKTIGSDKSFDIGLFADDIIVV